MIRMMTTICFAAATLFGPGACCCWSNQFVPADHVAESKSPKLHRSCCGAPAGYSRIADRGPAGNSTPEHCPSKGASEQLAAAPVAEKSADEVTVRHALDGYKVAAT